MRGPLVQVHPGVLLLHHEVLLHHGVLLLVHEVLPQLVLVVAHNDLDQLECDRNQRR